MLKTKKSALPIACEQIQQHFTTHNNTLHHITEYESVWRQWINNSTNKQLVGLHQFSHADHVNGTAQTFDNFVLRHSKNKIITVLQGEFQYHTCIAKFANVEVVNPDELLQENGFNHRALIISLPFSDTGNKHNQFDLLMEHCEHYGILVCLDIAYWGISKDIVVDLHRWNMIEEVTCSLSKPFAGLEKFRIGIRFSRKYCNDGISMLNECGMINEYSVSLGMHFMKCFNADWNWENFGKKYYHTVAQLNLEKTNTVIFAMGDQARFVDYNRGIAHNYRVCISEYLGDPQ